jgi:hypothetical protein
MLWEEDGELTVAGAAGLLGVDWDPTEPLKGPLGWDDEDDYSDVFPSDDEDASDAACSADPEGEAQAAAEYKARETARLLREGKEERRRQKRAEARAEDAALSRLALRRSRHVGNPGKRQAVPDRWRNNPQAKERALRWALDRGDVETVSAIIAQIQ